MGVLAVLIAWIGLAALLAEAWGAYRQVVAPYPLEAFDPPPADRPAAPADRYALIG